MLTLDQVKLLEAKVESLIEMIKSLYGERDALRDALQRKDKEIEELSMKVNAYESEQAKIEERVVNALNQLDVFQSSVSHAKAILSQGSATEAQQNSNEQSSVCSSCTENTQSEGQDANANASAEISQDSPSIQDVSASSSVEADRQEEDTDKQMDIF